MRIICLQENLQKSLSPIGRIISQRAQLPVLANVLISAKKNSFNLLATDLEVGVKIDTPAKIEEEGEITVPGKPLLEFVSMLPPEKIELETKGTALKLKSKKQDAMFLGIPSSEFPIFNGGDGAPNENPILNIDINILRKIIKNVVFAAATDDSRPVLNGVFLKSIREKQGEHFFVATDGYRLSFKKIEVKAGGGGNVTLIIPSRILKEVGFLIDKEESQDDKKVDVFLTPPQNQIKFKIGDSMLVGRLIEGEFPDYEKIIPQDANTTAVIEREDMLHSVKIASILARDSANIIRVALRKDGILISANAPQVGESRSFVGATITGEENEIAFNSRFLLEFLTSLEEKEIIFEMTGPLNPGVFRIKNDDSFLHLIMPVRIQE